ncbi:MAG: nucleoside 2-deoxyribosyltransferase [Paraglaciecola sp.]|jgi:nucleoside 2-deoxyribosyltransferase
MQNKNIYFAGSIRGGRNDQALYLKIIDHLKQYGTVLTEHVGDAKLTASGETGPSDTYIYERDMEWLRSSEIIVAEVTTPSLGVGYELGIAEALGKKVVCLYRETKGKRLSAMIGGNAYYHVMKYSNLEEVKIQLASFFK